MLTFLTFAVDRQAEGVDSDERRVVVEARRPA